MKRKLTMLSQRYLTALKEHLQQGPRANSKAALGLGREAIALGLETLDMARIHQGALATLEAASSRDGIIERAELFFREAITPIERSHGAALKAHVPLSQLNKALSRHRVYLAASNRSLKHGIARREAAEKALKKSGENSKMLLRESHRLQKHVRQLTHQILAAREQNRKNVSLELQNKVAQPLLGINIRLLTVKRAAALHDQGLQKDIAITQQLVNMAVKDIEGFARECLERQER